MNKKLIIRQKELDKIKWDKSILFGDLSGKMPYCKYCSFVIDGNSCLLTNKWGLVVENCFCAKAENKMIKSIK